MMLCMVLFTFTKTHSQSSEQTETVLIKDPVTQCAGRYYYYPNLEAYFDAKTNEYIYCDKGEWINAPEIPSGYRGYSMYNKLNVLINDYDDDDILQFIKLHKKKYPYNFHAKSRQTASISR